jgi:hypothetical protein
VSLRKPQLFLREQRIPDHTPADELLPLQELTKTVTIGKLLRSRHPDIVDAFLLWRAKHPAVQRVEYECRSMTPDGIELPPFRRVLDSRTGELQSPEGSP